MSNFNPFQKHKMGENLNQKIIIRLKKWNPSKKCIQEVNSY